MKVADYISTPFRMGKIIEEYSISLRKSLGQNFLIDTNVAKKILKVSEVNTDDTVLEIGSGIGNLTQLLLEKSKKIVCIEMDRLLAKAFEEIFSDNIGREITLITADALKVDYTALSSEYGINKMVSNLPYKVAAPLIIKILTETKKIGTFFLTIQKDIADRMVALPGDKNYSSYTLKINFLADVSICFQISRNCFYPKPFVDSVMVKIERKKKSPLLTGDMDKNNTGSMNKDNIDDMAENNMEQIKNFFNFVNDCFLHRRKKLINSFAQSKSGAVSGKLELLKTALSEIGSDDSIRAEELSLKDYVILYKRLNF